MIIQGQETFLLNPFIVEQGTTEELSGEINRLSNKYISDPNLPYEIATDIEIEADLLYIYGEFIARYTEEYEMLKIKVNRTIATESSRLRKEWVSVNKDKKTVPAMSYFEGLAGEYTEENEQKMIKAKGWLTRFKYAYASLETKQNALKKKLDAMKYDTL